MHLKTFVSVVLQNNDGFYLKNIYYWRAIIYN